MRKLFDRFAKRFWLRLPVSAILFVITLLLLSSADCGHFNKLTYATNIYVNNSGHDIYITPYCHDVSNVELFAAFSLPNGESHTLTGQSDIGVLFDGPVDSVTVDYGQGVKITFKSVWFSTSKIKQRSIYYAQYYDKEVKRNDKRRSDVVLTFTFTEKDYLDAM